MGQRSVIAVGGSTGAVEGLKTLCAGLPPDLAAAVLVVLHVGADGRNLLAGILDGLCPLRVETAADGQSVQPGHVYVGPAGHHLLVVDGVVRLGRGPRENMARPAIDPLFRSVAESYGPAAIGVLLSGRLNDGAAGLADLKRCGGVTVVENPLDATVPDMPFGALQASEVDHRASLKDLPSLLATLVGEAPGPRVPVPRRIALEIDIALGRPCLSGTISAMGEPVALACPDGFGPLSDTEADPPPRPHCQVAVDEAIRVALRIVEERAVLIERMAEDARRMNRVKSAGDFDARAGELRGYADVLRGAALGALP